MVNKILFPLFVILLVLKIYAISLTNFNLFGDEAQYWVWSKNLNFGYFSKPPFLAWIIRAYTELFNDTFVFLKLLPSIAYLFTAWSIYSLCKNIDLNKKEALSCALIFLFIPAVSFSSFIISTDIFLLLFWTLSLNQIIKVTKITNIKNFILLGIFVGLAMLSKYAAVYFIICLIVYILVDNNFRKFFKRYYVGFILSLVCAFLIILPNIIWNLNNSWVTFQHTSDNANFNNINISFYRSLEFLVIQIFMVGPFLFLGFIIDYKNWNFRKNQKILLVFSLPIFLIVFVEAFLVRANANWAAPALISFFVFLYICVKNIILKRLNILFNFIFCAVLFILIGTNHELRLFDRINGQDDFAKYIYSQTSKSDITNVVISDRLLFASMKYQLRKKGLNFHMPHKSGTRITNHFKISSSLKKEMGENFILIGNPNEINYLQKNYDLRKLNKLKYKFINNEVLVYEVLFN
tara:strand:- start:973 stop:2364 length:1392 start_codon:yes stop_codon:yes gene_type:complete